MTRMAGLAQKVAALETSILWSKCATEEMKFPVHFQADQTTYICIAKKTWDDTGNHQATIL